VFESLMHRGREGFVRFSLMEFLSRCFNLNSGPGLVVFIFLDKLSWLVVGL
jgi:hypothetical protein